MMMKKRSFVKGIILYSLLVSVNLAAFVGAGVLPYTYYPNHQPSCLQNHAIILLGEEPGKKWTDFGGGREEREEIYQTAAREFSEESLYQFFHHKSDVENRLKHKWAIQHPRFKYYMYPLQVHFVPADVLRGKKSELIKKGLTLCGAEKTNFAWVIAGDLLAAIRSNQPEVYTIDGMKIKLYHNFFELLHTAYGQSILTDIIQHKCP